MRLEGWIPAQVLWDGDEPRVRWIRLGQRRLLEPRFDRTIDEEMRHPFHHLFRRDTSMAEMEAWVEAHPGLELRGIVLHLSRCGSTRIAMELAANEQHVVASQPGLLESLLDGFQRRPELGIELKVRWVRALVGALGQPRAGGELRLYLKAEPWQVHDADLLRAAFPQTAMAFLYRDPLQVMGSQAAVPAEWLIADPRKADRLRMTNVDVPAGRMDLYRARVLAAICESGLQAAQQHGALLMNDGEAPEEMWERLAGHFGVPLREMSAEMRATMPDHVRDAQRVALEEKLRDVTEEWMEPVYQRLELERQLQMERKSK